MKKIFGFLLAVCLVAMLVVTPIGVAAAGEDVDINMGEEPVFTPGDINDDGDINLKDLVVLAQKVAGWDVEVNTYALNVDGEGMADLKDVNHLAQYLAGWGVELSDDAYYA